jgi:hypothetical protein
MSTIYLSKFLDNLEFYQPADSVDKAVQIANRYIADGYTQFQVKPKDLGQEVADSLGYDLSENADGLIIISKPTGLVDSHND